MKHKKLSLLTTNDEEPLSRDEIKNMSSSSNFFLFLFFLMLLNTACSNKNQTQKFTYLFKYKLESDGDVTLDRIFKLFLYDRDKLLYGFRLAAVGDHKLIVYDLRGKSLLVFKDKRL